MDVSSEHRDILNWLGEAFCSLPRCQDNFFTNIWQEGKLHYKSEPAYQDIIAEYSARLICATIHEKGQLLLVIPESRRRLPALLLSTALVMSSIDSINTGHRGRRVIYFGLTTGIKSDLSNITISRLSLAQVFTQTYHRGTVSGTSKVLGSIPGVMCIYSPLDPIESISRFSPLWVAIDCGDLSSEWWLQPLLKHLSEIRMPTIAWSTNPLSSVKEDFWKLGAYIYQWSYIAAQLKDKSGVLLPPDPTVITFIRPHVITGPLAETLSDLLGRAQRALISATITETGRLGQDALAIGWRYLRSLERLVIPLSLFESECIHYWGIKSIFRLKQAFDKFVSTIHTMSSNIKDKLDAANYYMGIAYELLENNDPPNWDALIEWCQLDVPEGRARVIVFSSAAQKSMFSFALLARKNMPEDDLAEKRIWLMAFKNAISELKVYSNGSSNGRQGTLKHSEDYSILPKELIWDFVHVNIPNKINSEKISPFLCLETCDFLLYPHQEAAFKILARKWGKDLQVNNLTNMKTLSKLSHRIMPANVPEAKPLLRVGVTQTITGKPIERIPTFVSKTVWEPRTEAEELDFLFRDDELGAVEAEYEDVLVDESIDLNSGQLIVIDTALEVKFAGGWVGLFSPDMLLHVVQIGQSGQEIERRYVRSLRSGDTVLYISGQRRQSLYDLVLSRVHRHPSIEIHLALIRQWQSDIRQGYAKWRQTGKTLGDLLYELQKLGSRLETDMAPHYWITGVTLRPRDRRDMRRIAEILNLPFTLKHYERIYLAAERIVGLHISLSLRLNTWIQSGAFSSEIDDMIDEATGLRLSDVRDSLLMLKVESISEIRGPFYETTLGKIERGK